MSKIKQFDSVFSLKKYYIDMKEDFAVWKRVDGQGTVRGESRVE